MVFEISDLIYGILEKINLVKPQIRLGYVKIGENRFEVVRYNKRTGEEVYKRYAIRVVPKDFNL